MPVHAFVDESKANGLLLVAAVVQPRDLHTCLYDASAASDEKTARTSALAALTADLLAASAQRLVLEQDDSLVRSDRETIRRAIHSTERGRYFVYEHEPPHREPLLWIPDTIAWCWAKGGRTRSTVANSVTTQRRH